MPGIDLGTTNSAIATMENGKPRILKISPVEPLLPSVVFIDSRGATYLGAKAREAMLTCDESEGNGQSSWKTQMGQDTPYPFPAAGKTLTATELSALVIGELLRVYRRDMHRDTRTCVITVPAKFDYPGYDATNKAAEMAGVRHHPLLQEPIAAALAYGFTTGDQRANWLVFDLGGGTLDISLLAVRDGRLVPIEDGQAGDSQLGGAAFDRDLLDFVLGSNDPAQHEQYRRLQSDYEPLRRQYRLEHFSEQTQRTAWNRLLLGCEQAKIELSRKEETVIDFYDPLCTDEAGREVRVEFRVTRQAYAALITPRIVRAVDICKTLLTRNRMTGRDLDQLIPIGGPMRTPLIQQALQEGLKVDLKMTVDPMTAVALGAAIHWETLEPPGIDGLEEAVPTVSSEGVSVRLKYEHTSKQPKAPLVGEIQAPGSDLSRLRVEIRRQEQPWASGHLPVDATGFFTADLPLVELNRPYQTRFTTQVLDPTGQVLATVDEPKIWHPFPKVPAVLANTLSVGLVGNRTDILVPQGTSLPAKSKPKAYYLAKRICKGKSDDLLGVPILQAVTSLLGEEDRVHADCYLHVGGLVVKTTDQRITADLPKGSEVVVTVEVNESQQIRVFASVPLIGQTFESGVLGSEPHGQTVEDIESRFGREEERLREVREIHRTNPNATVGHALEMIDRQRTIVEIQQQLERARRGESAATLKALKLVLELAATINGIWPLQTRTRLRRVLVEMRPAIVNPDDAREADRLELELARTPESDAEGLRRLEKEITELDMKVRHGPFYALIVFVLALGGLQVTAEQHQAHQRAMDLGHELIAKGAPATLTARDMQRIEAANNEIRRLYPNLEQLVAEWQAKNPSRDLLTSLETTRGTE